MKSISVLLLGFLCVGLFTRKYNKWTRLLLMTFIIGMILYITLA